MYTPTLEEYRRLVAEGKRAPVRRRIPADLETPVSAFLKLKPHGAAFLLESVEQGIQVGRYSFIGVSAAASIRLKGEQVELRRNGDRRAEPLAGRDPLDLIRRELVATGTLVGDDLHGPFGGAVGYLGYDMVRHFERAPRSHEAGIDLPDFQFIFPETLAVFDHVRCEIELLALPPEGDANRGHAAAVSQIEELLAALAAPLPPIEVRREGFARTEAVSNVTRAAFERSVERAKEYILAGDAFQIVLSQRLRGATDVPPFQIYRALRILNPSPYMFYLDFGDCQIVGSSPEMLVKLEDGRATLCPIAGTRPRGATPQADRELELELLASEKERAEHVMLVDLGRNDLGRVCELGSVRPESLMQVEKYSHVMHIVSRITGRLRAGVDMFDLLRAAFPAGTVSGAPKVRAMEIIHELEPERRGPYAGAVGYFGRQGDMDMCIAIRTLIMRGGEYFAQAGAGIVADSDPAGEYEETLNKIRALTRAIAIAEEGF